MAPASPFEIYDASAHVTETAKHGYARRVMGIEEPNEFDLSAAHLAILFLSLGCRVANVPRQSVRIDGLRLIFVGHNIVMVAPATGFVPFKPKETSEHESVSG